MNRRQMFGILGGAAAASVVGGVPGVARAAEGGEAGRNGLAIYNVREFGAVGDSLALDTRAINRAIDACTKDGGGVVYVPPGVYRTGTVQLKSNVTLYLEAGAVLLGSLNLDEYHTHGGPPLKGDANQRHLIFAKDAENVGLCGPGKVDGQGPMFWAPSERLLPPSDAWRDVSAHAWRALPRPSPMIEFYNVKNLRVEDVCIENSPGWTMRPIHCDNVFIRGVKITNPIFGSNTDGIDVTCSQNVFISDCLIDTGDDAICLKSEDPYAGKNGEVRVSKNITVTNCVLTTCCNGFKFGTATRGGYENVTFSNSVIYSKSPDLKGHVIAGIAIEMVDGGYVEGVTVSNIRMQNVRTPIFVRLGARTAPRAGAASYLRGVMIDTVHATGAVLTNSIVGLPGMMVEDVTISNVRIDSEEIGQHAWVDRVIEEKAKDYPEARMFGRLPASGFYVRHARGITLRDVEFRSPGGEGRPAVVCEDVQDLDVDNLRTTPVSGEEAVVKLTKTADVRIRNSVAPGGTRTFVEVSGSGSERITLMGNDLGGIKTPVLYAAGAGEVVRLVGNL
jgi:polygalacturonase